MRKILPIFFVFSSLLLKAQDSTLPQQYQLKVLSSSKASVQCYINGFPIYEECSFSSTTNTLPINLYLIGKSNLLVVTLDGDNTDISTEGGISTGKETELTSFSLKGKNQYKAAMFNNKGNDFSYLFKQAPAITDEQKVRDYAKHLLQLLKAKDAKGIAKEMDPKFDDYAKAFGGKAEDISNQFVSSFSNDYLKDPGNTLENPALIRINPLCEKRIYELTQGEEPFFKHGGYSIPVYVSMVNGELKIVR